MNGPRISSRIEKRYDLTCVRIHRGNVGAFPPVAVETGQRKVLEGGGAPALCSDHMIGFVCHDESFREKAVFAMISGSVSDLIA
jgi:hypothetical protein